MRNKISLVLNILSMIGLFCILITQKTSTIGKTFQIMALIVFAISSYTHYKNIKKASLDIK